MKPLVPIPRGALDHKPPHGAPCNRCGVCCMVTLCKLASPIFGFEIGRCPALLQKRDGSYECGLVASTTSPLKEAALLIIGAGDGCDARRLRKAEHRNVVTSNLQARDLALNKRVIPSGEESCLVIFNSHCQLFSVGKAESLHIRKFIYSSQNCRLPTTVSFDDHPFFVDDDRLICPSFFKKLREQNNLRLRVSSRIIWIWDKAI